MLSLAICSDVTIGKHMTFDFSPSTNYIAGTKVTAKCEDGFAFVWYQQGSSGSNSGSWTTSTLNVGKCEYDNNGEVSWKYDDNSRSLVDCNGM